MFASVTHEIAPAPDFDKPVKLLIVASLYHKYITDELVTGAKAALKSAGVAFDLVQVTGALEIPTAIAIAERTSNFDGYVALGCIIQGETNHFDALCDTSYRAISQLGLGGVCIGNGILTVDYPQQGKERANCDDQNNGAGAAIAALHLVALSRKWGRETKGIGFRPASGEFLMADKPDNGPKTA
ncbi:6,7-dimethyl-8-ribityllumazine synthase [Profundibacter sp.]